MRVNIEKRKIKIGKNMEKILVCLAAGVIIGLSQSKSKAYFIMKRLPKELEKIDKRHLSIAIQNLYKSKLIDYKENEDGTLTLILTERGKKKALTYKADEIKFKTQKIWDGYWRIIIFDIPDDLERERNTLSRYLAQAGAYRLQKSVFVYPYDCKDEFDFLVEFLGLRKYVRFIIAKSIDNELHLKEIFELL